MILCIPPLEEEAWPTLGPQVCAFIEAYLVHGPGDIRGEPARLDDEKRALIYRAYEVFPQNHEQAGRRRFRRVGWSLQKGSAKTELAAWIAACELHADAPVRCVGFDKKGQPIGGPVHDPYIPMVAYTEEQSELLAYGTLYVVLSEGPLADDFDIGLSRIMRKRGDGQAVALATAPGSREGARTTFEVFDETHLFTLSRLKRAHRVMLMNLPKRKASDAWALEVTTAPIPGEGSVAEATMDYAEAVRDGRISDSRLFFFHRQASDNHDLASPDGLMAAVLEAAGPTAEWKDINGIIEQWRDPTTDKAELERLWLNRCVQGSERAFDVERWRALATDHLIPDGALITLGFDGSRSDDATALVATEVETCHQQLVGLWERPPASRNGWQVPAEDVDAVVNAAFERWQVCRFYGDPRWWESWMSKWAGQYGDKVVVEWPTNRITPMAYALRAFATAIQAGELTHDGNKDLARHIGNACRHHLNLRDAEGQRLWLIHKERPDSPHKMDGAMACTLSLEARNDAVAAGAGQEQDWGLL